MIVYSEIEPVAFRERPARKIELRQSSRTLKRPERASNGCMIFIFIFIFISKISANIQAGTRR